jgi:hypothetical protein
LNLYIVKEQFSKRKALIAAYNEEDARNLAKWVTPSNPATVRYVGTPNEVQRRGIVMEASE